MPLSLGFRRSLCVTGDGIGMPLRRIRFFVKRLSYLPALRTPISRLWNTYEHVRFVYHVRQNTNPEGSAAKIDPFRLLQVEPEHISRMAGDTFDFISDTGDVVGGSWDQNFEPMAEYTLYELFEERFCEGVSWDQTEYYDRVIDKIRRGDSIRYATVKELEEKLSLYEQIYEAFEGGEYNLQSELAEDGRTGVPGDGGYTLFPSLMDQSLVRHEIAVNVGRNGRLLLNDGRHRVCLALVAGLDSIPVRIVVRHEEWQDLRKEIARTIDEALEADYRDVHEYVQKTLENDLEGVFLGLDHPDIEIIFERRLPAR